MEVSLRSKNLDNITKNYKYDDLKFPVNRKM